MYANLDPNQPFATQWALNPSAYQNVSNDQVDWAALAQQWIMMKEATDQAKSLVEPPPPPPIKNDIDNLTEGGEAPMEVEVDKEDDNPKVPWNKSDLNWSQQWDWNNTWSATNIAQGNTSIPPLITPKTPKAALLPTPFVYSNNQGEEKNYTGQNEKNFQNSSHYWQNSNFPRNRKKGNTQIEKKSVEHDVLEQHSSELLIDANKRRQLPAWIREGLEKREREMQKQLMKEREAQKQEELLKKKKEEEKEKRKVLLLEGGFVKSKFDSDSEESNDESASKGKNSVTKKPIRHDLSPEEKIVPFKTQEEKIQDTMLMVRKIMTEVLLEVTTEQILQICQEELKRYRFQISASAVTVKKTPAIAKLSGKLGLGIYEDSESSSDSDSEEHSQRFNEQDTDLKEVIRRKKAEFQKTEKEIDLKVQEFQKKHKNKSEAEDSSSDDEKNQDSLSQNKTGVWKKADQVDSAVNDDSTRSKRKAKYYSLSDEKKSTHVSRERHKSNKDSSPENHSKKSLKNNQKSRESSEPKRSSRERLKENDNAKSKYATNYKKSKRESTSSERDYHRKKSKKSRYDSSSSKTSSSDETYSSSESETSSDDSQKNKKPRNKRSSSSDSNKSHRSKYSKVSRTKNKSRSRNRHSKSSDKYSKHRNYDSDRSYHHDDRYKDKSRTRTDKYDSYRKERSYRRDESTSYKDKSDSHRNNKKRYDDDTSSSRSKHRRSRSSSHYRNSGKDSSRSSSRRY